jgi:hypothetical protein
MEILLFSLMIFFSKEYVVIDNQTKEELVGVKISTTNNDVIYTDFDGKINTKNKIKSVSYISYELVEIKNDSIFMKKIN